MARPEELSSEQLLVLVARQAGQISAQAEQIGTLTARVADLVAANEALADRLARVEHLLSRNSGTCSAPPSKDDGPGKTAPKPKRKGRGGPGRSPGKQPGAPGTHLAWSQDPDERRDRFPQGRCGCGHELAGGTDLGVVDSYQQHEIPAVTARVTQYEQHAVRCRCGAVHTAPRPDGARSGPVGYGPNLQALCVYLMVMHYLPVQRCVQLLQALTGAAPSVGFVHGMLARAAGLLVEVEKRIRALVTLAYAVCMDETPVRVGSKTPRARVRVGVRPAAGRVLRVVRSVVLTMLFLALLPDPRAEGATRVCPADLGRVLGLDRAPQVIPVGAGPCQERSGGVLDPARLVAGMTRWASGSRLERSSTASAAEGP